MISKENSQEVNTYKKLYSLGEEIANSVTHGIGTGLSIAGLTVLVVLAALYGDVWRIVSFNIYGTTLILLYLSSTLYHGIQNPKAKRVFQIFDHAAIFLLIAGTYTPFLLVSARGTWGWTILALIWGIAILGVSFKALFIDHFHRVSAAVYILMGWFGVIVAINILGNIPPESLIWLGVGGVVYTAGILFLAWTKLPYGHAIWHVFVLGGSICHYFAVMNLLPGV